MKPLSLAGAGLACALAWAGAAAAGGPPPHEFRALPVSRNAALWNRPGTDGQVLELLPRRSVVELLDHARNARGLWWYVDSAAGHGWLRDIDFPAETDRQRRLLGVLPGRPRANGPLCQRSAPHLGGGGWPTLRAALPQQHR